MPIPTTRSELVDMLETSFDRLWTELENAGSDLSTEKCVDDWTVKELIAVRVWWTKSVVDWIEAGQRGEVPMTPAAGYSWHDTPKLNQQIVSDSKRKTYAAVLKELKAEYDRACNVIDRLDDSGLLDVGVFGWAGKYPVSRWLSINTVRQYTTARTYVRRAIKNRK